MSAGQNIQTARQMYQAFGSGDVQAILDLVTDDVDWSTDASIVSAPWYGSRHGKDGVAGFFEAIGTTGRYGGRIPAGLWARVIQGLLALNACIWHNWLIGAPVKRSLIAYDHV